MRVSRFGLGTMTWGTQIDQYAAAELLDVFLDAGGTLVDTAPVYGDGRAEGVVGTVVADRGVRDDIVLAGKCAVGRDGIDASRGTVLNQLDRSLRDLRTDHLDLWQVHRWDPTVPLDETLSAVEYAVTSGRVRYAGISNYTPWQTVLAHEKLQVRTGISLVSTQVEYSLLCREPERELADTLDHTGMGMLAWSPLGRGVLTGKYRGGTPVDSRGADDGWGRWIAEYRRPGPTRIVEATARAADGLGHSPAQVALAWLRDRRHVASSILGARTARQLSELLEAEEITLPPEITVALDDVS